MPKHRKVTAAAKKKFAAARARTGRKFWGGIATLSGAAGFTHGVVSADIARSPSFKEGDAEKKVKLVIGYLIGRITGMDIVPDTLKGVQRKFKPWGWLNIDTAYGALGTLALHGLKRTPNFPFKTWVRRGLKNGQIPFHFGRGVGRVFAANPHGNGREIGSSTNLTPKHYIVQKGMN